MALTHTCTTVVLKLSLIDKVMHTYEYFPLVYTATEEVTDSCHCSAPAVCSKAVKYASTSDSLKPGTNLMCIPTEQSSVLGDSDWGADSDLEGLGATASHSISSTLTLRCIASTSSCCFFNSTYFMHSFSCSSFVELPAWGGGFCTVEGTLLLER